MRARILVVEDNAANLELARYLLASAGYEVLLATNGAKGLEVATRELPDLIISDLQMPVMDGYALIAELRRSQRCMYIPVLALTAFSMPGDRDDVMRAYAVDTSANPTLTEVAHGAEEARISLPIVSSHGSEPGTGVVWTINRDWLRAYDAEALGAPIFVASLPPWSFGSAFTTPLQANGRVYVGATGAVLVFGLSN